MSRRISGLMAVVVWIGSMALGAEKPMVALQIASLDRLASEMVNLKVLPESSAKTTIAAGLGASLGNPSLAGVDTTKPIDLYVFLPKTDRTGPHAAAGNMAVPQVAFVFPAIGDGMACITAMARSFPATNRVGSIYQFSMPLGATGLNRTIFVGLAAGKIITCDKISGVQEAINFVESQPGESPLFMELPGTIRVGVDIQATIPLLEMVSQMATAQFAQQALAKPGQPDPAKIIEAEMEMLLKLAGDIQGVAFTVSVTPESINILSCLDPKDGTAISRLISGGIAPSGKFMALPPADALLAWIGSGMDKWMDALGEPYIKMIVKMGTAMGPQGVGMGETFRQMMTDIKGIYAGDIAAAIVPDTDGKLGLMQFIAVSDPVKAKQAMDKMMSAYSSNSIVTAPGLSIKVGAERTYKNINIQSYAYAATASSNTPPLPMADFIGKMRWEAAYAGNEMIYVMGSPELMNSAIDRLSATNGVPVTSNRSFTRVFPQMRKPPASVYTVSLVKLAKKGLALLPDADPALLASIPEGTGGMAGYSTIKGDNLLSADRIMLDEIEGLKIALPMIKNILMPLFMPPGFVPKAIPGKTN
ncbi:MAG: hypothetical protein R6X19_11925 [Kiritimatiellia bacterium]